MSLGFNRQDARHALESGDETSKGVEFYLKNHLGSTMLVANVSNANTPADIAAAYDYRAFGEQVSMKEPSDKVTENFTGKERDDETELNYFGARYLDPMLGLWISVDPKRQFASPYLYVGNGYNPIIVRDDDGNELYEISFGFRGACVLGVLFNFNLVVDTDRPFDSDLQVKVGVGFGFDGGLPIKVSKNPLAKVASKVVNSPVSVSKAHAEKATDLAGTGVEVHMGLGYGKVYSGDFSGIDVENSSDEYGSASAATYITCTVSGTQKYEENLKDYKNLSDEAD